MLDHRHVPHHGLTLGDAVAIAAIASAACTLVLAIIAVCQMRSTETAANAAERSAKAAEDALDASVRPLVTDVPRHTMGKVSLSGYRMLQPASWASGGLAIAPGATGPLEIDVSRIVSSYDVRKDLGSDSEVYLTVPVRNIGPGVALVVAARLARSRDDLRQTEPYANAEMPSTIAPSQVVHMTFQHHEPTKGWLIALLQGGDQNMVVEVAYTDVSGRLRTATRLWLAPAPENAHRSYLVARTQPLVHRVLTADVTWDPRT